MVRKAESMLRGSPCDASATLAGIDIRRQLVSVQTADDTTDQIAVIKRSEVDPGALGYGFERSGKFCNVALRGTAQLLGGFDGDRGKAQRVTRRPPPDNRQVGRDDRGDLRVSAGRLVVGEQQDRLPRAGDLDRAGDD